MGEMNPPGARPANQKRRMEMSLKKDANTEDFVKHSLVPQKESSGYKTMNKVKEELEENQMNLHQ